MFNRISTFLQMRRSTAFMLTRADDRLLDDIGLCRGELEAMHLGLRPAPVTKGFRPDGALPVLQRA